MSITLRPWAVALLIATFGILVGFSVSQISSANSDSMPASASSSDYQIVSQLRQINSKLGATYKSSSVLGVLDSIDDSGQDVARGIGTSDYSSGVRHNTYEICQAIKDSALC